VAPAQPPIYQIVICGTNPARQEAAGSGAYTEGMRTHRLTAVIEREGDLYVSLCPELDIASQGKTVEEARRNLTEALELFFEVASPSEVERRFAASEVYVTSVDVSVA
jgi:predicted RNase H-like HicB family nuclease